MDPGGMDVQDVPRCGGSPGLVSCKPWRSAGVVSPVPCAGVVGASGATCVSAENYSNKPASVVGW